MSGFVKTAAALLLAIAAGGVLVQLDANQPQAPRQWKVEVLASYPHDPRAFTQGLFYQDGVLYESTGQYGQSSIRIVDLQTGRVIQRTNLPASHFGEGAAMGPQGVVQITLREGIAHIWDPVSLERRGQLRYRGEGWGLASDGQRWFMTDGSSTLQHRNLQTFDLESTVTITFRGLPLERVNEMEYVNGRIWANVWLTDEIVRFDPHTGVVDGFATLRELYPAAQRHRDDVLNGIAYNAAEDVYYVTGKNWPRLFAIRLHPPD